MTVSARILKLVALVFLVSAASAQQEESDTAADAYRNGRYLEAYYIWKALAAEGDAAAAYNLGVLHATGQGVSQDFGKAVALYRKSAKAGYAPAQFNLGMAYLSGQGVEQDYKKAAKWWLEAVEQDNVQSTFNLAMLYDNGLGVKTNKDLARKLYKKAAELGDARAAEILASLDSRPAAEVKKVSAPGPVSVKREGWINRQPDDNYTVQVLSSKDQSRVRSVLERYPMQGGYAVFEVLLDDAAWYKVLFGSFSSADEARIARNELGTIFVGESPWLRQFKSVKSEISGSAGSATNEAGTSTPGNQNGLEDISTTIQKGQAAFNRKRYEEALQAWLPLARADVADAQYGIGFMYESGWGVEKDPEHAFQWYQKAANLGHAKSQYNLGLMYVRGLGVDKDLEAGQLWIERAAEQSDPRALEYLANAAFEMK